MSTHSPTPASLTSSGPPPPTAAGGRASHPRTLAVGLAALLLGLAASLLLGPHAPAMRGVFGDRALAARTEAVLGDRRGYQSLAVVEVSGGRVTHAGLGSPDAAHPTPTPTTPMQLGSITKTFNGFLLADALQRGEVRLDQPVADLLPELRDTPAGTATLQQLAQHTAGLPSMLPSEQALMLPMQLNGRNPFTADVPAMLAEVRGLPQGERGEHHYSNVGASLLGHALARRAGAPDWAAYVRERLFVPLGMTATTIARTPAELPADRVVGRRPNGRPLDPWTSPAMAPAGATTWTTPQDMAAYARAILERRVPGMAALEPSLARSPQESMGLAWFVRDYHGHRLTWHNGSTQGGSTMLALDRDAGRAVMVFSTTGRGPETLARQLVTDGSVPDRTTLSAPETRVGMIVLGVWVAELLGLAYAALRGRSRAGLVAAALDVLAISLVAAPMGPWHWVGGPTFGAGCGLAVGLLVVGLGRGLPRYHRSRVLAVARVVLSAALVLAVVGVRLFLP